MPLQMISKFSGFIRGKRILYYLVWTLVFGMVIGCTIFGQSALELPSPWADAQEDDYIEVQGRIYKLEEKDYGQLVYIESEESGETYKWLVYDYDFQSFSLGNEVQVTGTLVLFDSPRNQGNFDSLGYYNTLGIVAAISSEEILVLAEEVYIIRNYLYELRKKGIERIYNILGEEEGSLLIAMVFGDKNDMDDEQEELYQKIGISHIFAISGLHISLLSLVVYQLIRRSSGSFLLGGFVSSIFLGLYILMIGVGVSAIRAGTMFFVRVGADITGRVYDVRTSLAIGALCILLPNPRYLYYSGFLLSFGAILGVIYLQPFWQEFWGQWCVRRGLEDSKILMWLIQGLSVSVGIQGMILPVLLYSYYEISPYSILLNLLVIPLMTILLGLAMLGIVLSLLWYGGGAFLLLISGCILRIIDRLGWIVIQLPGARWIVGQPWMIMIILYYGGIILGLIYIHIGKHLQEEEETWWKYSRKIAAFLVVLPALLVIQPSRYDLTITMLDIGQGDCFYVQGPNGEDYLIDGGSTDITSVGKYRIETYLRSQGVDSIEYVFISHGDSDHLNGIEEMLQRQLFGVSIETIVFTSEAFHDEKIVALIEVAQAAGTTVAIMEEGDQVIEGSMTLTYLAPLSTYSGEIGNASSMVLELSFGELQVLFTGDVEGEGEDELLEILYDRVEETGITYEVLKVAHHGSKNSTPEEFLELISPSIALISAGIDSIYGHPHEELLERLELAGCSIYSTADYGGVTLSYNENGDTIHIKGTVDTKE